MVKSIKQHSFFVQCIIFKNPVYLFAIPVFKDRYCLFTMCVYTCVLLHACMQMPMHMCICLCGDQKQVSGVLLIFQTEPLMNLKLTDFSQAGWSASPRDTPASASPGLTFKLKSSYLYGSHLTNYAIAPAPDNAFQNYISVFNYLVCKHVYVHVFGHRHATMCMWRSEYNSQEPALSFHYVSARIEYQTWQPAL